MIKEENKSEFDLQLSLSEVLGVLFKSHKPHAHLIITKLFQSLIPDALSSGIKEKVKFALFILDDMVEFLGVEVLGSEQFA
jgi:hypothetical protein